MDAKYNDLYEAVNDGAYKNKLPYSPKSKDEQGWRSYQAESARLDGEFQKDALEYVGLTGHPKASKAYLLAWEQGHASGYSDVLSHLSDLASLLND